MLLVTHSFSDFSEAVESVRDSAGTEIRALIESAAELDHAINTVVTWCDMGVYTILHGMIFSETTMDDEFGGEGGESGTVAGTMEIGLLQRTGNMEKVLRNPKVILERDLVEPECY